MYRILFLLLFFCCSCEKSNGNVDPIDDEIVNTDSTQDENTTPNDSVQNPVIKDTDFILYIGTYTDGGSKGIYMSRFDADSAIMTTPKLVATINNPSFQCITPNKKQLWSVNESWSGTGQVVGYAIDSLTGGLTQLASYTSNGSSPCFVSYHESTMNVLAANYSSGNVVKIPVTETGSANGTIFNYQQKGTGPNKSRQEGPHAHSIKFDLDGKYAYSCDLGADKIYVYTIEGNELKVFKEIKTAPGAGPRHIDFHPQKRVMVVVHELNGTVVTYLPDVDGCFSVEHATISTVPNNFSGESKCADIHFTPNGKFLYASNRGNNSIVIYKMDEALNPQLVDWQTQNLNVTRNFTIDSSGKYLIAANQDGNNIVVFEIDQTTGILNYTGKKITVSKPVCVTLLEN